MAKSESEPCKIEHSYTTGQWSTKKISLTETVIVMVTFRDTERFGLGRTDSSRCFVRTKVMLIKKNIVVGSLRKFSTMVFFV